MLYKQAPRAHMYGVDMIKCTLMVWTHLRLLKNLLVYRELGLACRVHLQQGWTCFTLYIIHSWLAAVPSICWWDCCCLCLFGCVLRGNLQASPKCFGCTRRNNIYIARKAFFGCLLYGYANACMHTLLSWLLCESIKVARTACGLSLMEHLDTGIVWVCCLLLIDTCPACAACKANCCWTTLIKYAQLDELLSVKHHVLIIVPALWVFPWLLLQGRAKKQGKASSPRAKPKQPKKFAKFQAVTKQLCHATIAIWSMKNGSSGMLTRVSKSF